MYFFLCYKNKWSTDFPYLLSRYYCKLDLLTIFKSLSVGTLIYTTASYRTYYSYFTAEGLGWQHHFLPKRSLLWAPRFSQYPSFLSCSIGDRRDHYFKCISLFLCYPWYKSSTNSELKTTAISTCISSKAIRTCNLLVFTISLVSTYCELDLLTIFK